MDSAAFWGVLKSRGLNFFAGVPDSTFGEAYNFMVRDPDIRYVPAVREDVALGVASAAYFAGGYGGPELTTVNKFLFADDSRTTLGTGLAVGTYSLGGMANSGTAAYFGGGYTSGGNVSTVFKFAFSNDGRTTLGTGLSFTRYGQAGMASSVAGYVGGGRNSSSNDVSTVDRFLFSNDSRTTLGTGLSSTPNNLGAFGDSSV